MGVSLAPAKLNTALERKATGSAPARICTLGPIIHNPQVLAEYESRGVVCVKEASQLHPGDVAVIRAHGITRQVEEQVKLSGAEIVDATCPKVKKAQLHWTGHGRGRNPAAFWRGRPPRGARSCFVCLRASPCFWQRRRAGPR